MSSPFLTDYNIIYLAIKVKTSFMCFSSIYRLPGMINVVGHWAGTAVPVNSGEET